MRASQFVLKLAHLAISMKPRVPRGLRSPTPIMAPTNTSKPLPPRYKALWSSRCAGTTLANVKFCYQPKDYLKHSKELCNGYSNNIVVFMDLILIYSVRFWLSSEMAET